MKAISMVWICFLCLVWSVEAAKWPLDGRLTRVVGGEWAAEFDPVGLRAADMGLGGQALVVDEFGAIQLREAWSSGRPMAPAGLAAAVDCVFTEFFQSALLEDGTVVGSGAA